ncbi:MAG: cupin domain-containing protein, partial [Deltaproteobacteria bacterium]|nr:cupin domain-containing protein [Deltaproteobacteria bacterium]
YKETWRASSNDGARPPGTAIYYLLKGDERSAWHRIDSTEIWHHYAGAALELRTTANGRAVQSIELGPDIAAGQVPQHIIDPGIWQAARSLGEWTLVGCTVSPGFDFTGFELASPGFAE